MRKVVRFAVTSLIALPIAIAACAPERIPVEDSSASERARADGPILNIAHRGASGKAPENTTAAYDLALENGADYVESDVRLTKDGALVVVHDETLERTTRGPDENCTGPVGEKTLAQIKTCDIGALFNEAHPRYARKEYEGLKILALEEVFRRYRHSANFYIDLKVPATDSKVGDKLLRLMEEHELREDASGRWRVLIVSFHRSSLKEIHNLEPSLPLMQAYPAGQTADEIRASLDEVRTYAVGINPPNGSADERLVEAAHARCLQVHPYAADERREMEGLIGLGVDGIFTKFPGRLDEVLGEKATDSDQAARRAGAVSKICRNRQ